MGPKHAPIRFVALAWLASGLVSGAPAAPKTSRGGNAQNTVGKQANFQDPAQPGDPGASLADAARLARANKGNATKPAKSYDDDNFPRSTPVVKKNTSEDAPVNHSMEDWPSERARGKV